MRGGYELMMGFTNYILLYINSEMSFYNMKDAQVVVFSSHVWASTCRRRYLPLVECEHRIRLLIDFFWLWNYTIDCDEDSEKLNYSLILFIVNKYLMYYLQWLLCCILISRRFLSAYLLLNAMWQRQSINKQSRCCYAYAKTFHELSQ